MAKENVVRYAFATQISGQRSKSMCRIPQGVIRKMDTLHQNVTLLPEFFMSRDVHLVSLLLDTLAYTLLVSESRSNCEMFVAYGADILLLDILFSEPSHWKEQHLVPQLRKGALNILRELCSQLPFFKEILGAHKRDVLALLFSMMKERVTFEVAVPLTEDILALKEDHMNGKPALDLSSIPDFTSLVSGFSWRQLASFCRILAMVVFEPEDQACCPQDIPGCIVAMNHKLILSVPDMLMRLVKLLKAELIYYQQHQLEVMFVLCALCRGISREQVQDRLAELGIVNVLSSMFHNLDWKRKVDGGFHGSECLCDFKTALKIQYLRLVHNFCDRDSCNTANKQRLMEPLNQEYGEQPGAESCLIVKIISAFLREPAESPYRFWLASCIEAFLRGAETNDQNFVAAAGVIEHLVTEIMKGGVSCPTSLQVDFDLLGELVKFNTHLLKKLDSILCEGDKFGRFIEVLVLNLVDSNVFVRSVLLSLDSFRPHACNFAVCEHFSSKSLDRSSCKIVSFIEHNFFKLLCDLMITVQVEEVNQDNICVLNTALIFFIFAEKTEQLEACFQHFRTSKQKLTVEFRGLLESWKSYYLRKRVRDYISLEFNTNIPFSEWSRIVELLQSSPDSPFSQSQNQEP